MIIRFDNVSYTYQKGTPYQYQAIHDVNTEFEQGKYYAIVGQTGSGKSTLIQNINALLKPTTGTVTVDDITITHKTKDKYIRPVRKRIGMVFQFPESQLFEDTVEREMIFGPKNFKMNLDEAKNYAHRLLMDLGFSRDVMSQSPFQMSGGQMRKIAIVSILAMNPDIIVVDEPTAGLDPQSKRQVMRLLKSLQTDENKTIILISHDMNEVARYADEVIVMKEGSIVSQTSPKELFKDKEKLADWHIGLPEIVQLQYDFEQKHQTKLKDIALTEEAFVSLYKEWQHEK